jgi:hypothetical protein
VPLGDIDRLRDWAETEDPPYSVWRLVEQWVAGLATDPWQWPSAPEPLTAPGNEWEVRSVEVPGSAGVEVIWEHEHSTGVVNLLYVGRRRPQNGP